jgi:transcriptional regulator GlxA family with amidase domain
MSQRGPKGKEPRVVPIVVVLPPRTLLLDVAGPIEVLRKANIEQDALRFEVTYVSPSAQVASSIGLNLTGMALLPERLPDDATVMISGSAAVLMNSDGAPTVQEAEDEAAIVEWLRQAVRAEHRLVSICSGALLAGRAGLLDGRSCTTHYACTAELRLCAPAARVLENRLYVEDGNCFTSAGITAGIDLMLHLLARMTSPALALAVSRYLVVYLRRAGADPQLSPWLEGRNHIHPAIHRVQDAIMADPVRAWSLGDLAEVGFTSPRHLSRLFNDHAGMSVTDYLNRVRVALARELVNGTTLDMERIAERAGFASTRQLRRAWSRFHIMPPSHARRAKVASLDSQKGTEHVRSQ